MSNSRLRDKLLELETYPEDLTGSIREVMDMKERPLKPWERPFMILCCVVLGMMLIGAAFMVATDLPGPISKAPTYIIIGFAFAVLLLCCLLVLILLSLKRGTWRLRDDQFATYAGAGFVFYMYLGSMTTNRAPGGWDIGAYIVFAVLLLVVRIQASELRLREHMLRNELALAKLAELITDRTPLDPKHSQH
ncbi:MAG: hypothetical protein NTZ09_18810 [Candidatus Hydrogenedentes bacterium]|nr:hypothetical protein [Candidatus Hydrogenedentota bacterium]